MTPQQLPLARAINAGLRSAMERDDRVLILGEDVGDLGGVFRVTDGLKASFGAERVVDTPLGESGIVGTAIGLAMAGYRPVVEIQFDGFVFPAFNQITTQLAKLRYRTSGAVAVPLVIRMPYAGGVGSIEHHQESPETYFAHTPGLRVVTPANAADGWTMTQQAIASPDPVIVLEPKSRYWEKGEVDTDVPVDLSERALTEDLHAARVVRSGEDVTIAAYGPTVKVAAEAAVAAAQDGTSVEVLDLRSLSPLDVDAVAASVERTGRLVVAHESTGFLGFGSELAAQVTERCFYAMQAPVLRVTGYHTPYPPADLEHDYLPGLDRVLDAVERTLTY